MRIVRGQTHWICLFIRIDVRQHRFYSSVWQYNELGTGYGYIINIIQCDDYDDDDDVRCDNLCNNVFLAAQRRLAGKKERRTLFKLMKKKEGIRCIEVRCRVLCMLMCIMRRCVLCVCDPGKGSLSFSLYIERINSILFENVNGIPSSYKLSSFFYLCAFSHLVISMWNRFSQSVLKTSEIYRCKNRPSDKTDEKKGTRFEFQL